MATTYLADYPVTHYAAGQQIADGDRITVIESQVDSHPDNTATLGANRIAAGDPVAIGDVVGVSMTTTTATTDKVVILTRGIFALNVVCNGGTALVDGGPVYLHATAGTLHSTYASGMKMFGTGLATSNDASALIPVRLDPPPAYAPTAMKVAKVALEGGAANAIAFAWQNPEAVPVFASVVLDITTAGGTATAVMDVGAVNAATDTDDTLLDGVDINAVAVYDSRACANGTTAFGVVKMTANGGSKDYITGKILTEAAASLVGNAYIFYTPV